MLAKKYIIAVSGGPDSMYLLNKYYKKVKCVCHVNYNVRQSAIKDEWTVRDFCTKNKVKLEILNVSESMYKKYKELVGNNFEQIARSIRYDFFLKMSKKYKVKTVLVAHHLDDFLETCIMQEEKKSIRLFYGMHENSEYKGLKIYRPLLKKKLTKKHIISYCAKNSIPFGIDETNFHDKYTRNKIRFRNQNLTPQQYKDMLKKYESYNKKNRKHYLKTIALFNAWKKTNFSIIYYKNKIYETQYDKNIIFELLKYFNEDNISLNKINSIIVYLNTFLIKNDKRKKFRLSKRNNVWIEKDKVVFSFR